MKEPELTNEDLLEEIDATYEQMGQTADLLPGECRWTSDWCGSKLQMMPLGARGLYSEMLTQAWADRARLRMTSEDEIMRLVRAIPDEWAPAWSKVRGYFVEAIDPRTGQPILVNRKQLKVYVGSLRHKVATLVKNRRAAAASVAARKAAKTVTPVVPAPKPKPPAPVPPPVRTPPPPSTAAPKSAPSGIPCPECGGALRKSDRSTSPGGQRYPAKWWCKDGGHNIALNDPRVYDTLSDAGRAGVDHELRDYERATAASEAAATTPTAKPRVARATQPAVPSALERSRMGHPF